MPASAKEKLAEIELSWSFNKAEPNGSPESGSAMKLEYEIQAFEELYVSDRLWDYDASNSRIPDPFGVYRFVRDGSLRLVFGQAPIPLPMKPRNIYQPLYSKVVPGTIHRRELLLQLPIDEYSALARDIDSPHVIEELTKVFLVFGYRLRSDLDADPQPPPNESAESAGYIVHDSTLLVSGLETVAPFQVNRRTGSIARFALPGDAAKSASPAG